MKPYKLNEGFELTEHPKYLNRFLVKITDLHQNGLDTSLENNPVIYDLPIYLEAEDKKKKFKVISVFKRKPYKFRNDDKDGNPVLYALKKEKGYDFDSFLDKQILLERFESILRKAFKDKDLNNCLIILPNRTCIPHPETLIGVPSSNELNEIIKETILKVCTGIKYIEGVIRKLSTDEVYDKCCFPESKFRNILFKQGYNSYEISEIQDDLEYELNTYMSDGIFKRHKLSDELRNTVQETLSISFFPKKYYGDINGKDILLFDDTLTFGHSLQETINILYNNYSPKSVTILTLFSKKFNS